MIDGTPPSTLHDLRQKLTFVPAGVRFAEWQQPRSTGRVTCFYFDVRAGAADPDDMLDGLSPRLFFESPSLSQTVCKITSLIERGEPTPTGYGDALGVVLAHELAWLQRREAPAERPSRGGLAGWQARNVRDYIEAHLAEPISLADLAAAAKLSPSHLSRAFKQSYGMPPHRFHLGRRVERAKLLLAEGELSVTSIAHELGFSDASAFAVTFRKFTGRTPTEYQRSLI